MILSGACVIFYFESLKELPALRDSGFTHLYTCTDSEYVTNTPTELCAEETWSVMYSFYFTIVVRGDEKKLDIGILRRFLDFGDSWVRR